MTTYCHNLDRSTSFPPQSLSKKSFYPQLTSWLDIDNPSKCVYILTIWLVSKREGVFHGTETEA